MKLAVKYEKNGGKFKKLKLKGSGMRSLEET